jgi:hypothetical protein
MASWSEIKDDGKRVIRILVLAAATVLLVFPGIFVLCFSPYVMTLMTGHNLDILDMLRSSTGIWLIVIGSLMILGGVGVIAGCFKLCRLKNT